jgi:hypothetical protein
LDFSRQQQLLGHRGHCSSKHPQRCGGEKLHEARAKKAREKKRGWEKEEDGRVAQGKRPRKAPTFPSAANLTAEDCAEVEASVRPYTMLDYLFRLRIKANYEEAAMFTDGPASEGLSSVVALDMTRIASAIMLAHEVRIAHLVGKSFLTKLVSNWISSNSAPSNLGIGRRVEMLAAAL